MKRTNFVFILFCIGVLLQSCAAPLAVMGVLGYNQMGYTDEMRALPYEERADEWPIEEYGEMLTMEFVHQSEDGIIIEEPQFPYDRMILIPKIWYGTRVWAELRRGQRRISIIFLLINQDLI